MDTEMKVNELEQVNGGNSLDDVKDVLKKLIPNPFAPAPEKPIFPIIPEPVIAKTK